MSLRNMDGKVLAAQRKEKNGSNSENKTTKQNLKSIENENTLANEPLMGFELIGRRCTCK